MIEETEGERGMKREMEGNRETGRSRRENEREMLFWSFFEQCGAGRLTRVNLCFCYTA